MYITAFEIRLGSRLCRGISMFFSICLDKKNADAIEFLGILKNNISKNKKNIYFCQKKRNIIIILIIY